MQPSYSMHWVHWLRWSLSFWCKQLGQKFQNLCTCSSPLCFLMCCQQWLLSSVVTIPQRMQCGTEEKVCVTIIIIFRVAGWLICTYFHSWLVFGVCEESLNVFVFFFFTVDTELLVFCLKRCYVRLHLFTFYKTVQRKKFCCTLLHLQRHWRSTWSCLCFIQMSPTGKKWA